MYSLLNLIDGNNMN